LVGIITIYYFLKPNFTEYNIKKSISACIVAKKRTTETFNLEETKKFCEKEIRKMKE